MKIIIMMVFSLWVIGCTSEDPIDGLSFPLKTPNNISVEHLSIVEYPGGIQDKTKEIFISDGNMWRMEWEKPGKGVAVILFDGKKIHTNSNEASPQTDAAC